MGACSRGAELRGEKRNADKNKAWVHEHDAIAGRRPWHARDRMGLCGPTGARPGVAIVEQKPGLREVLACYKRVFLVVFIKTCMGSTLLGFRLWLSNLPLH